MPTFELQRRQWDPSVPPVILLALAISLFSFAFPGASAGEKSLPLQLAPEDLATTLTDTHGKEIHPLACAGEQPATVLIFTSVDCPIANAYAPEISRIAEAYAAKGIRLTLVHVDPSLKNADAARHAADYGLDRQAAIVIDREHLLVNAVGATSTPEAAVVTRDGKVVYRGRINNLYADFGDKRAAPSEHDLRDALDAVMSGEPVPAPTTKTIGCIIEPL